jgi:hypothetical protein
VNQFPWLLKRFTNTGSALFHPKDITKSLSRLKISFSLAKHAGEKPHYDRHADEENKKYTVSRDEKKHTISAFFDSF